MTAWLMLVTMLNLTNHTPACQTIQGEWILGADLARAIPAFSTMPRDTGLGYSPAPGASRVFQYPELKRIGSKYGVPVNGDARACFEWKVARVSEDAIRAAILESLHRADARV